MPLPVLVRISIALLAGLPTLFTGSRDPLEAAPAGVGVLGARAPLFADGSVSCSGADDLSQMVGIVRLIPTDGGLRFHALLLHGAPNWDYYVELSQEGSCKLPVKFHGFKTDANGFGLFEGQLTLAPGDYDLLVDVVSDPSSQVPPDPKLREIAPAQLLHVTLP